MRFSRLRSVFQKGALRSLLRPRVPVAERVSERQVVVPQRHGRVAVVREGFCAPCPSRASRSRDSARGARRPVAVGVDAGADRERTTRLERGDAGELPAAQDVLQDAGLRARDLPEIVDDEAVGHVELRHAPLGRVVEHALRASGSTRPSRLAERGVVVALELAAGVRDPNWTPWLRRLFTET